MQFMEVIAIAKDGFFKPTNITSGGPTSCMEDPTNIIYVVNMEDLLFYHLPVHIHIFTLTVFMAQDVKQLPSVLMVWGCFTCQTGSSTFFC